MDLLKALKRTIFISGMGLLALGATEANAASDTSVLGHISASVQGNLEVDETSAINFGNFSVTACAPCAGGVNATVVMDAEGHRTTPNNAGADKLNLLVGTDSGDGNDDDGIDDTGHFGTGGQAPGFYHITNTDGIANIYVSFANNTGSIIDSNHPNNYVSLDKGLLTDAFRVDSFVWETDDGSATGPNSGYTALAGDTTDIYGKYTPCAAGCNIRVGATLHAVAAKTPTAGQYKGTFYMMVSY
jgi:hypothetical protein